MRFDPEEFSRYKAEAEKRGMTVVDLIRYCLNVVLVDKFLKPRSGGKGGK